MKPQTEAQMQRLINLEIILIIIAIGADMLIAAIGGGDWGMGAIIIAGFAILGVLYYRTLHLDRIAPAIQAEVEHILHHDHEAHPHSAVGAPPAHDVAVSTVTERPILHVSNFALSRNFYAAVLAPLGYAPAMEFPALSMASFGIGGASDLWIKGDGVEQKIRAAFSANSPAAVDRFCAAAAAIDAIIVEAPGERPERGPGYYAAAIHDPDGYTIEAVYRSPDVPGESP